MEAASLKLGLIGNCAVSALVDDRARVVWACVPRFDGDPMFNALIDSPEGVGLDGTFQVVLEDFSHSEQSYDHGTAVLRTRLYDTHGDAIEVTDFMPRFFLHDRPFRPMMLVRRIRPLQGRPRIRVILRPVMQWGTEKPERTRGSNHMRFVGPRFTVRLTTNAPLTFVSNETAFALDMPMSFVFGPDETLDRGVEDAARLLEERTIHYWRDWTRRLAIPLEYQEAVIRAAITLKMCLYEETGAIVAAMTTSIPEAPGTQRNWDYRYCWLRDAFFVVRALNSLSETGTMEDYLRWLRNVVAQSKDGHVQPLYGIGLEDQLVERIMPHLRGYRGMGPVRAGNQAYEHFQHDVYGNIVLGSAQAFFDHRLHQRAGVDEFALLERAGERAFAIHDQPDAGMWELRTRSRVHTSSVLMNWAACDRLAKIAQELALPDRALIWRERADLIKRKILDNAWSEHRQAFVESFGGKDLDASVLLMAEVGFIDPKDPRFVSTVEALEASLCDGPYMRRYEAPDDFGRPETSFNICAFWRIDALARIGRTEQARELFEALLASRNHLGLLSEDTHPETGELWGNFPQTYSMVGIINGAMRLSKAWDTQI
ncbi:glycoside hydrolase family 15 protein [Roseateles amylovorans]|uniref:Glycoside hydrolase family 15 protein n=1 Tax=Roseateles amylovorans TaxID=2978473 RepID=A0ABY6ASZ0_9BURK|nr:glycoside hydrolase family 15 protein [Roseateles amylovorans]UXH76351.1 glycoside hydrolase family 15 protein [Roseateles amylovorans]